MLKNGNHSGDLGKVRQCGAKTRAGSPCRSPAMRNGRCRMHGGASTGPRTLEALPLAARPLEAWSLHRGSSRVAAKASGASEAGSLGS